MFITKAKVDEIPIFGLLQKQDQPSTFDNPLDILGETVTCSSYYTGFFQLFLWSFQLSINILAFILPQKMYGFDA